jgi:murein DD-endopeptidase MepM/ murein hydrolase activator NlpD
MLVLAVAPPSTSLASTNEVNESIPAEVPATRGPRYVFPFTKVPVSYPRDHLHYPAVDVEGCYARVLAPTSGVITEVRKRDKWDPTVDEPGTRGGLTITMHGDDTVRYYFSHLGRIKVRKGQRVEAGHWIGVIGSSGNARVTRCHLHLGMSRICDFKETALQQGEIWPQKYLDAWKAGNQLSPRKEKNQIIERAPRACLNAADSYVEEFENRAKRKRDGR